MGRPSQAMITKEGAADAALAIIDEQGLNKLSLQVLAKELGVKAPSLYYHFKNKAELLEAIAKAILKDSASITADPNADWKDAMVEVSISARKTLMRHPNAAPLLLEFYPRHIMLPAYNYWVTQYKVAEKDKMIILEGLEKLTFGSALLGSMSRAKGLPSIPKFNKKEFADLASAVKANKHSEDQLFVESIKRFLSSFES